MKKSKVLDVIYERVRDYYDDGDEERQRSLADHILYDLLKAGMLPPPIEFEMGGKIVSDVGWESEDG